MSEIKPRAQVDISYSIFSPSKCKNPKIGIKMLTLAGTLGSNSRRFTQVKFGVIVYDVQLHRNPSTR